MRSRFYILVANISVFAVIFITGTKAFAQESTVGDAGSNDSLSRPAMVTKDMQKVNDDSIARNVYHGNPEITGKYRADFRPDYLRDRSSVNERSSASGKRPTSSAGDDGWHFAFAPYLYATGLTGTLGARGRTADIDLSFADIFHNFDVGFMGAFEARKKRVIIMNDVLWVNMSQERNTPGSLYSTGELGVKMFVWQPSGGYRVVESEGGTFDLLGGIRLTSVETHLEFTTGRLPGFDVDERKTWAAPVFGGKGVKNLTQKVFLSTVFDIGGGFGTHFTGQFYGGAGYKIKPQFAIIGGYRYLKNNYDDHNGFVFNTQMSGLVVGAKVGF